MVFGLAVSYEDSVNDMSNPISREMKIKEHILVLFCNDSIAALGQVIQEIRNVDILLLWVSNLAWTSCVARQDILL